MVATDQVVHQSSTADTGGSWLHLVILGVLCVWQNGSACFVTLEDTILEPLGGAFVLGRDATQDFGGVWTRGELSLC